MDRVAFTRNTLRDFVSHLTFRVTDDDIIVRHEERITDLTLCAEGFTGTGSAQNQTVGVFQLFAVNHNQVVGQGVQAIIQAFFARLVKFLCGERNEDIVSCFGLGCCSLQGTSAQSGDGQRSAS